MPGFVDLGEVGGTAGTRGWGVDEVFQAHDAVRAHDEVVHHVHADGIEVVGQLGDHLPVDVRHAVCAEAAAREQHDVVRVVAQGAFGDEQAGLVVEPHRARQHAGCEQHLAAGVGEHEPRLRAHVALEQRLRVAGRLSAGADDRARLRGHQPVGVRGAEEGGERPGDAEAHARHLHQLLLAGGEHARDRLEPVDQRVRQLVHVLPRHRVKQQKLDHLVRRQRGQPHLLRPLFQTLAVTGVHIRRRTRVFILHVSLRESVDFARMCSPRDWLEARFAAREHAESRPSPE